MALPPRIPPVQEQAIATYSFTDLVSGLGYETFFIIQATDSGATRSILTPVSMTTVFGVSTDDGETTVNGATAETNFDTSVFNLPRTVKGNAYANFKFTNFGGAANSFSVKFQVVHSDLSTDDISSEITSGNLGGITTDFRVIEIPLTQTRIKRGEKIRAIVKVIASSGVLTHFHSGADSKLLIPFRIDL